MAQRIEQTIDLGVADETVVLAVPDLDVAGVQVRYLGDGTAEAWPTGTVPKVVVEVSIDGNDWYGLSDAGLADADVEFAAAGLAAGIDVSSVGFIRARVSTKAASTNKKAIVTLYAQRAGARG